MMTIDDDDYDYHDYDDYRDYILTCVARWANDPSKNTYNNGIDDLSF